MEKTVLPSPNSYRFTAQKVPLNRHGDSSIMNQAKKKPFSGNVSYVINDGARAIETLKKTLVSRFISVGCDTEIETPNRNQEKYTSFNHYKNGMREKRNGNANVKYAWYFGSKDELKTILSHGFSSFHNNGTYGYGFGVYLSPFNRVQSAVLGENGFKHALFCRVILGNMEVVNRGSTQYKPSSEEFDSGIDSLECPEKYIVWIENINTHILPEFIFSFRAPSHYRGFPRIRKSGETHFSNLMKDLSKFVPADAIELISKEYAECTKGKICIRELFQRARQIAGNELLNRVVKNYLEKLKRQQKPIEQKESKFVEELISQFSSQLNF